MKPDFDILPPTGPVGIAVSGGRDSMTLLHAASRLGREIVALHVNHGLRPTAGEDAAFVARYCKHIGVRCEILGPPTPPIADSEASARAYRYDRLTDAAKRYGLSCVLLAHQADDQAETVLLNLFRGSGGAGLAGMPAARGLYRRPLLRVSRADIDLYVKENEIPYRDDESNADPRYARNFVRTALIPLIRSRWPECVDSVTRCADSLRADYRAFDALLPAPIEEQDGILLPLAFGSNPAIRRIVYLAAKRLVATDLDSAAIDRIAALFSASNGARADVKKGVSALRDYDGVFLFRRISAETSLALPWSRPTLPTNLFFGYSLRAAAELPSPPALGFDADKIPNDAVWRTRQTGDVFTPYGGGTRPLKEFLIDRKVPLRFRDKIPLLCYNHTVLVVAGTEISRSVAVEKNSRSIAAVGVTHERH